MMTPTIEQIQEQISNLQKTLEELKNQKLEISRNFTGHYFKVYQGKHYRRMESDYVPIWEIFVDVRGDWLCLDKRQTEELENIFIRDCIATTPTKETTSDKKKNDA